MNDSKVFHPNEFGANPEEVFYCRVMGKCKVGSVMIFALEKALMEIKNCKGDSKVIEELESFLKLFNRNS